MNYKDPEVLEWVNLIRRSNGYKPLKRIAYACRKDNGEMKTPANCNCPIAMSLHDYIVTKNTYIHKATCAANPLPKLVSNWIDEFDYLRLKL